MPTEKREAQIGPLNAAGKEIEVTNQPRLEVLLRLDYLDFIFVNASFTRGANGESGASFKYSSYSLAISSSWPFPVRACATIKCEIANCLWSASVGTFRALARARSVSPFCNSTLASAVSSWAL